MKMPDRELKFIPSLKGEGQGIVGGGENGSFCCEWGQGCPVTSPESSQLCHGYSRMGKVWGRFPKLFSLVYRLIIPLKIINLPPFIICC